MYQLWQPRVHSKLLFMIVSLSRCRQNVVTDPQTTKTSVESVVSYLCFCILGVTAIANGKWRPNMELLLQVFPLQLRVSVRSTAYNYSS